MLTRIVFGTTLSAFKLIARRRSGFAHRDHLMARFAPVSLMLLPLVWAAIIMYGFSLIYWGFGVEPYRDALVLSGSSLTTLGFAVTTDLPTLLISIFESLIGLMLIALLISFLPTMYSLFNQRESAVSKLYTRAEATGGAHTPTSLIIRAHTVAGLDQLRDIWEEWEDWFIRLEEAHTSFPALNFFRSPRPDRSWITASGLVLDSAAIYASTIATQRSPRAALMLRSGFVALREIADLFNIEYDPDPAPDDPISIRREEFMEVYDDLSAAGVPVIADREKAWRNYAGWRVNYDTVLLELCELTMAPSAAWSSDRTRIHISNVRMIGWPRRVR